MCMQSGLRDFGCMYIYGSTIYAKTICNQFGYFGAGQKISLIYKGSGLGEPLQTLSELVGASLSEPHTYGTSSGTPTPSGVDIYIYIYIYISL